MKIYHTYGGQYPIKGRVFQIGTVVLELDNGIILCCGNFNIPRNQEMLVYIYFPNKKIWEKGYMKNKYTEMIWDYYRRNKKKLTSKPLYKKKPVEKSKKNNKGMSQVKIPDSVRWSMTHPLQGGGVSPR